MRNIILHAVVRGEADAEGGFSRVVVGGHAFGLERLLVRVEGPRGRVEQVVGVDPRTHQWIARFNDGAALREAAIALGAGVRVTAADLSDPDGCYSTSEARVAED